MYNFNSFLISTLTSNLILFILRYLWTTGQWSMLHLISRNARQYRRRFVPTRLLFKWKYWNWSENFHRHRISVSARLQSDNLERNLMKSSLRRSLRYYFYYNYTANLLIYFTHAHTYTHIHELHRAPKLILVIACAELRAGLVVLVGYRCWDYRHLVFAEKFLTESHPESVLSVQRELIVEARTNCSDRRSSDIKY